MDINKLLLGLHTDPFIITVWRRRPGPPTRARRNNRGGPRPRGVAVVVVIGAIVTAAVWVSGHYPATWQMLLTQLSMFLGVAWSVYQVMSVIRINGHTLIEWIGYTTPGGETRPPAQAPGPDHEEDSSGA